MKRIIKTFVTLCTAGLLVFGVSACNANKGDGNSNPPASSEVEQPQETLTLNVNELSLAIGDEFSLIANYNPVEGQETAFISSNPEIASVDEYGRIVAKNAGNTVVTVTYGDLSSTCAVTVGYKDMLPVLTFEEITTTDVQVGLGESINLGAYVVFNNIQFTDATITYMYSDDSLGTMEDGVFTPSKAGTTEITVTAAWRGVEGVSTMTKTITLTSVHVVEIVVNEGTTDFTMYNLASLGGNEYNTTLDFVVKARENGAAIQAENISVVVSDGEDVIEYANSKIQALKPGNATVSIFVTDNFGGVYEEKIEVTVLTSVGNYDGEILFSAYDGELPIVDIFGADVEIISAICEGEELSVNANKDGVLGLSTTKDGPTSKQITVYSDTQAWVLNLLVYSGIIDEPKDLEMFHLGGEREADYKGFSEEDTFSGYYILANDIDCADYLFGGEEGVNLKNPGSIGEKSMIGVGLTGVFDGQGYSITNLTPNGAGLLAAINGGTLKNISISGTGSYTKKGPFLCAMMRDATLQNVYVDAGSVNLWGSLGLSKFILNSTLENCVFKATIANKNSDWGGLVFKVDGSVFKDCYVISNKALSGDKTPIYDAINQKNDTITATWVEGLKRYTSDAEMIADKANNDLTSFVTRYWDVQLGIPVWRGGFDFAIQDGNGNTISDKLDLGVEDVISLCVSAFGEEYCTPMISIEEGADVVSVNGATITATATGVAIVKITWSADGKEYEKTVQINVGSSVKEYSEKLIYSAVDGLFFNSKGEVVAIVDIFESEVVLVNATHITDTLTVLDGKVFGLTTSGNSAIETSIVLYAENKAVKVNVDAYTLVIDEATDLDYFYLGNDRDASTFGAWTDADKFDGYYVLVKDIDATGYVFGATKEGEGETPKNLEKSGSTGTSNLQNMGLTGTFDGQGYSITNFAPNGAGLFAAVNGGTVKNVSITNAAGADFNIASPYLATILRDATIENVYIDCVKASKWASYAFARFILGETKLTNCIINVNMGTSNPSWGAMCETINATVTFENCYVISKFALNGTKTPASDASNIETTGTKFEGVKRYNTAADMIADAENNNYDSFLEQYWDKTSGMPVWKKSVVS